MGRTDKFRGYRTHGRGMKAGRGAGLRGGRGNAGMTKHKYISVVKYYPNYFGRHGFKRPQSLCRCKLTINIGQLGENLSKLLQEKRAKKQGNLVEINLEEMGIDKLLGKGGIKTPLKLIVREASKNAIEKVQQAGGEVVLQGHDKHEDPDTSSDRK